MELQKIADELIALCREGKNLEAIEKFYAADVVSVEPIAMQGMSAEVKGIDAVRQKNIWWFEHYELHSVQLEGPFVYDNQFAVRFETDATRKQSGQRVSMKEVGIYTVDGGKIVREEFFYHAG